MQSMKQDDRVSKAMQMTLIWCWRGILYKAVDVCAGEGSYLALAFENGSGRGQGCVAAERYLSSWGEPPERT